MEENHVLSNRPGFSLLSSSYNAEEQEAISDFNRLEW